MVEFPTAKRACWGSVRPEKPIGRRELRKGRLKAQLHVVQGVPIHTPSTAPEQIHPRSNFSTDLINKLPCAPI